ncbi:MAG TPA: hypothetical protein VMF09_11595 [Solirubrobacteraceae bacterium]|nr:hypothetical protein [Solirubrobacteraceae bacterium]
MCDTDATRATPLAERLVGKRLPPASFDTYRGHAVTFSELGERLAIYCYPGCVCSPEDGYDSPARDSAQHRAFVYHREELRKLGFTPVGVSSHPAEGQRVTAVDSGILHPLLSDPELQLAVTLNLPTFNADATDWYCRLTMLAMRGRIVHATYPIHRVGLSAWDLLSWLRNDGNRYTSRD